MGNRRILQPGRNCWRIERADRVAFLIDGAAYFKAFRSSVERAKHSILLLGWDIDSRIPLICGEPAGDLPVELGAFLNAIVSQRRRLHAHLLTWDYALIYAAEREWLPAFKLGWRTHRRLHFKLDDKHPVGASHHQKVVVIDDRIAFVGGFDLSKRRWDTPEHIPNDPRRTDPDGVTYPPFHDVQWMVNGDIAAALGDLARERWLCATGKNLRKPSQRYPEDQWPPEYAADLENVYVAISRTAPAYEGRAEIREAERLFLDAIQAAQHFIYIENQYFTSTVITDALAASLMQERGPEIVVVLPCQSSGWLEQRTMDLLRQRLIAKLYAADRYKRLFISYPDIEGLTDHCIGVHSKVFIVDDIFARVGSANLNNRSMGVDTECDLSIEANGEQRISAAIATFRNRLLSEHLGASVAEVSQTIQHTNSLLKTIEALQRPERTLKKLEGNDPTLEVDPLILNANIIDPEKPLDPELVVDTLVPGNEGRRHASKGLILISSILVVLLALTAAWQWTPLKDWLDMDHLLAGFAVIEKSSAAPFIVIGGFLAGGLIAVPVTALVVVTLLTFGPWPGILYCLLGTLLSAALNYGIGCKLGRNTVQRFAGAYVNRLSSRLAKRGVLTVTVIRMLPVAPFSVVNVLAGASQISFRDYMLGTFFGMTPGIAMLALVVNRLGEAVRNPGPQTFAILAVVIGLIIGVTLLIRRWLVKRDSAQDMAQENPANSV